MPMHCHSPFRTPLASRRGGGGRGFSLVELLVVIGIIAALVGILIPVVGRMRREAYKVDTAALINTIRSAAESYHSNFKSYPGPFNDDSIVPSGISGSPTGTEQLVLSLSGGLKLDSNNRVTWDAKSYFTPEKVLIFPSGPANLNPRNAKTYGSFLSDAAKYVAPGWDGTSNFRDAAGRAGSDSNLPEFVDRYPGDELPILYLRARRGAPGIIGDGGDRYQYDLREITGYTLIGNGTPADAKHGLRELGDANQSIKESMAQNDGGADALPYFRAPGVALPSGFSANKQVGASPRSRDSYILISAGADRLYGTYDDITSFGPVE